jgi:hypothetical protein
MPSDELVEVEMNCRSKTRPGVVTDDIERSRVTRRTLRAFLKGSADRTRGGSRLGGKRARLDGPQVSLDAAPVADKRLLARCPSLAIRADLFPRTVPPDTENRR